jgi:hypothetical protein
VTEDVKTFWNALKGNLFTEAFDLNSYDGDFDQGSIKPSLISNVIATNSVTAIAPYYSGDLNSLLFKSNISTNFDFTLYYNNPGWAQLQKSTNADIVGVSLPCNSIWNYWEGNCSCSGGQVPWITFIRWYPFPQIATVSCTPPATDAVPAPFEGYSYVPTSDFTGSVHIESCSIINNQPVYTIRATGSVESYPSEKTIQSSCTGKFSRYNGGTNTSMVNHNFSKRNEDRFSYDVLMNFTPYGDCYDFTVYGVRGYTYSWKQALSIGYNCAF